VDAGGLCRPVIGKNFYPFDALKRTPAVRDRRRRDPALAAPNPRDSRPAALRDARLKAIELAAAT
jgi:hypothetical protein